MVHGWASAGAQIKDDVANAMMTAGNDRNFGIHLDDFCHRGLAELRRSRRRREQRIVPADGNNIPPQMHDFATRTNSLKIELDRLTILTRFGLVPRPGQLDGGVQHRQANGRLRRSDRTSSNRAWFSLIGQPGDEPNIFQIGRYAQRVDSQQRPGCDLAFAVWAVRFRFHAVRQCRLLPQKAPQHRI